ncbi:MAG TPA: hypothetical protein VLA43_14355 [Longimicrobiales bacterium]|nr:hypothetical protein [Longimicrobiales bacterium]
MRVSRSPLLAAALLATLVPGAAAQNGTEVRLYPRLGLASPDAYFYEYFKNFYGDGPMEWTSGSLGRSFAAGLGAEVSFGGGGILVRAEVLRTFDGWLSSVHSIERPRVLFEPPQIINTWLDVPTAVTATSVQIVLPTRLEIWRVSPYVLAGVGGKFYDFGEPTEANEVEATLPYNGFTWGGDVGAGVTLPFWKGLTLDLQVRDALTKYWGKTQHDLYYTTALLWRVR